MSPPPPPRRGDPSDADAERIGAWLDDELDVEEAARLEARLRDEPGLRVRLERIRRVRERLAGAEDAAVPDGFVAAAVRHATATADEDAPASPADEAGAGADPTGQGSASVVPLWRRRPWLPAAAAAAILVGVLLATPLLPGPPAQDDALEEAPAPQTAEVPEDADGPAAEDAPEAAEDAPEAVEDEDDAEGEAEPPAPADADRAAQAAAELGRVASLQALITGIADAPGVAEGLGLAPAEAAALQARTLRRLEGASVAGGPADRCEPAARERAQAETERGETLTAVAVRSASIDGQPVLGHAYLVAPAESPTQRLLVVVTEDAPACDVRAVETLVSPGS